MIENKVVAQSLKILATLMKCGFCAIVLDIAARVWCDRKRVVTSPRIGRYNNDALGGYAANEFTLEIKPKR